MEKNKVQPIYLLVTYFDIFITLCALNMLFKLLELLWTNYNNISSNLLYSLFFVIPFTYFLYTLFNNPKLNKTKASNLTLGLFFLYIASNLLIEKTQNKTDYVAITSNISAETDVVTYGDGQESELYIKPFKNEGLFKTNDKEFDSYINEIEINNEVVILQHFNYYQTGLILGHNPVNFKSKVYTGTFGLIKKCFSYSYYLMKDLFLLSSKNFILSLLILTLYQVLKQRKNGDSILNPVYYTYLFKKNPN